jgi:hypothetical protein
MRDGGAEPAPESRRQRWRAYHLLALLPAIGMLGGLAFANRVRPLVFGLPFLFAWLAAWVIATSAIMGGILLLDRAHERREDAGESPPKTSSRTGAP